MIFPNLKFLKVAVLALALLPLLHSLPAPAQNQPPQIGAQIWVEPGHTPQQIDQWFALLKQHNMPVTRLFVMWNFIEKADGSWDWSLYDAAYASAQKHNVRVVATLMPNFGPPHRGYYYKTQDGAIPTTQAQLDASKEFIKRTVERYKGHPAHDTWMLMNEPGQAHKPDPLAMSRFHDWLRSKYVSVDRLNAAWITAFKTFEDVTYSDNWSGGGFTWPVSYIDWNTFWRSHLTWYLGWVSAEIRKYDNNSGVHVNPHALIDITSRYGLPTWRKFLTSLGASIHPVWHFTRIEPKDYNLGIGFVCDMVRGASQPNPFWVTELQGGHNIYTAEKPLRASKRTTATWLWHSIGSGADRTIFWCLNARGKGTEAAEWSMLTMQGQPSERLEAAAEVASVVNKQASFFSQAKPALAPVTILLSQETMMVQERAGAAEKTPGRGDFAHKYEALGIYKALMSQGINPQVKFIQDYNYSGGKQLVILPHATALTHADIARLEAMAEAGATVLVTGLSGMYDEEEGSRLLTGQALEELTGQMVTEVVPLSSYGLLETEGGLVQVRDMAGLTKPVADSAKPVKGDLRASRFANGKGQVIYWPGLVGHGAWFGNTELLAKALGKLAMQEGAKPLVDKAHKDIAIRAMQAPQGRLAVISNSGSETITLNTPGISSRAQLWHGRAKMVPGKTITLSPMETAVVFWPQ